jgi:TonB family protein
MRLRLLWCLVGATLPLLAARSDAPPLGADAVSQLNGTALLRSWAPPEYPADALRERVGGVVTIRMVVDEKGLVSSARILEAGDTRLGAAALAAAKKWVFSPALDGGVAVASSLDAPVMFLPSAGAGKSAPGRLPPPDQTPQPSPRTDAKASEEYEAEYPGSLLSRKLSGIVRFKCSVTKEGRPTRTRVLLATHADFVLPALESLERWRFTPAMQGDLPIESDIVGEIKFDSGERNPAEVLAANTITAPDGTPPALQPGLLFVADPVAPFGPLIKGEAGSATVIFTVATDGRTRDVAVQAATGPDYGRALAAAVEAMIFSEPMDGQNPASVPLMQHAEFPAVSSEAKDDADPQARLAAAIRAKQIGGSQGLDAALTPLYRTAPVYPASLAPKGNPPGHAEIEFLIDRDGRARLPNVVSATDEAFGWSAATAVSQWVFKPPLRKGQPTVVRVRIPFEFKAPAK